jgi:putative ABC transport system substrate-binding protein
MKRREFIAGLSFAAAMGSARAQQLGKAHRIAIVNPTDPISEIDEHSSSRQYQILFPELRRLGYAEGQNLTVERYSAEGHSDRYDDLAREVVARRPDLIVMSTSILTLRFKAATASVPIVAAMLDPVGFGVVANLAKPGGNITGVSVDAGIEIIGKRLELLRQADPRLSRLGLLASRNPVINPLETSLQRYAQQTGVSLLSPRLEDTTEAAYLRFFDALEKEHADGLIATYEQSHLTRWQIVAQRIRELRLPAIFAYREHVELGALMAYTYDRDELFKHMAAAVAQVLGGTAPAEIPVYQSSKFALIINLKTAEALGLTIPTSLLVAADEVIE